MARRAGASEERLADLALWKLSPAFSDREKTALELAERMTRNEPVDDELWSRLTAHFDEGQIIELVAAVGAFNAFNRMSVALRVEITR